MIWGFLLFSWFLSCHCNVFLDRGGSLCCLGTFWDDFFGLGCQGSLWEGHATEDILVSERDITFYLLPELHYTLCKKVSLTLSRWTGFFWPKLEGLSIGHHFFSLQFHDVSTGKFVVRWWRETLLMKAQWCWWGLVIILNTVPFADLPWELERGLHLLCQFLVGLHPRNLNQFLLPARHIMPLGSPGDPAL